MVQIAPVGVGEDVLQRGRGGGSGGDEGESGCGGGAGDGEDFHGGCGYCTGIAIRVTDVGGASPWYVDEAEPCKSTSSGIIYSYFFQKLALCLVGTPAAPVYGAGRRSQWQRHVEASTLLIIIR